MSVLNKLSICGVRSFSPDKNDQQIVFTTPVTLLLGQNGCGKTTIIESIKYACTGELPAGGGSGFLNNPNLTNKQTIQGNVKMRFFDRNGNEVTIGRFMQVNLSPKEKFKSTLTRIEIKKPDGSTEHVCGRINDVSDYCTQALNVSAPILNHVLFCHQEQSSWPLDEPKKLKERFDEIFDSAKHNKCVDALRKLQIKKDVIELKKKSLEDAHNNKIRADDLNNRINLCMEELRDIENDITRRNELLVPIKKRLTEIIKSEGELGVLQRNLIALEEQKKGLIEQQEYIKKNISVVFDRTDEELRQQMEQFDANTKNKENSITKLQLQIADIDVKTENMREVFREGHKKIGQLKEEQRQQSSRLQKREHLIQDATKHFKNQGYDTLKNGFKVALVASEDTLRELDKKMLVEEEELQRKINQLSMDHCTTKQEIDFKKNIAAQCQSTIDECTRKLSDIDGKNSKMKKLSKDSVEIKKALLNLTNSLDENKVNEEIEGSKMEIAQLKKHLEKLQRDYTILMDNHATEKKIENEKTSIIEKTSKINQIKNEHSEDFFYLFDDELPNNELLPKINELLQTNEPKVKKINHTINDIQKKLTTLEINIKNKEEDIRQTELEVSEKQGRIKKVCKEKPLDELLEETQIKKENLQRKKGTLSSTKVMYESYIRQFEGPTPCCPVCSTNFAQKNNVIKDIIASLKKQIECSPRNLADCQKKLLVEEEMFNNLQQLKFLKNDIDSLTKALPELKKDLRKFNNEMELLSLELASKNSELEGPERTVTHCRNVQMDVGLINQHEDNIKTSKSSIINLERKILSVSTKKSLHETKTEISEIQDKIKTFDLSCETNEKKLGEYKNQCQELTKKKEKNLEEQMLLQQDLQEGRHLEEKKAENETNLNNANICIEELEAREKKLKGEYDAAYCEKEATVKNNKQIAKEANDKVNQSKQKIEDLEKLQDEIDNYCLRNNEDRLKTENEKLDRLQVEEQELNEKKIELTTDETNTIKDLAKRKITYIALQDNILLREKQVQEKELEFKIDKQKIQIGHHNYKEEKSNLLNEEEKILQEINNIKGGKDAIAKQVEDYKIEQEKPTNKNAYKEYKRKLFEYHIEKSLNCDLQKFAIVLEKSILRFHKDRMVHINKVIRELWRAIYRGNDIDYIEIKTENEIGTEKKRSYQYKVVQVKKGVEIDMRTRCSAGQRVLASLVIRMALAETFSTHCGILALDEPTTNLDRQNILSLSDALVSLIDSRKDEKNFQLLIITHDEEFLNTLTRVQSIPHYWKVSRNNEGFSVINKVSM